MKRAEAKLLKAVRRAQVAYRASLSLPADSQERDRARWAYIRAAVAAPDGWWVPPGLRIREKKSTVPAQG